MTGERKYIKEISMDDVLPAEDGKKYPVNVLMNLYVATHGDVDSFADSMGISKAELLNYVKAYKWNELRDKYLESRLSIIFKLREESLSEEISLDQKEQYLRRYQRMQYLDSIEEYLKKHGHLFLLNEETGEIVKNAYGMPVMIPISFDDTSKIRRELMGNIELQLKVLKESGLQDKKPIKITPGGQQAALAESKTKAKSFLESDE